MEIRKASALDAPKIHALECEIFSDAWSEKSIFSTICSEGGICYVAVKDTEIVAYVLGRMIAPEAEIYRVATAPAHRKRGIAYRLLDYAVKCERGRGLECIFLEVRSANVAARNLYHAYGFAEMGVRRGYYSNPTDDAVIMVYRGSYFNEK